MILLLAAALSLTLPAKPPPAYGFFALHGTNGYWTNRVFLGYPQISEARYNALKPDTNCTTTGTDCKGYSNLLYFSTNYVFPPGNVVWLTVTNKSGLESELSCRLACPHPITNVTWVYPIPPAPPVTNIVTVSAGTNSISFTNPPQLFTWYRLRGLSWTSAVLQASWTAPPSWSGVVIWSYPSNAVPRLSIFRY